MHLPAPSHSHLYSLQQQLLLSAPQQQLQQQQLLLSVPPPFCCCPTHTNTPHSPLVPCPLPPAPRRQALRTCKSPVAVGLRPGQARGLSEASPGWMVAGSCGMVQLGLPPPVTRVHFDHLDPARRTLVISYDPDQALRKCAPLLG